MITRLRRQWPGWTLLCAALAAAPISTATAQRSKSPAATARAGRTVVFVGVTIIDVRDGRRLEDQTVVVRGNRLRAVGARATIRVPRGARVIDARGKYLIPGLWDMHVHIDAPGSDDLRLQDSLYRATYPRFIAHGVTGIREMAQRFPHGADSFRVWQRDVLAGRRVGPRAIGPSADVTYGNRIRISTPEDARRVIDSLHAAGDAFVKYHDDMGDPALFFALAREARRVGIPLVGHTPVAARTADVADSGLQSIEHVEEHHQCLPEWITPTGGLLNGDGSTALDTVGVAAICAPAVQAYIRAGTWITPTLAAAHWTRGNVDDAEQFVRILYRLGARRFLAGTDYFTIMFILHHPRFLPGASAAEEVMFLTRGGLTPLEALQAATLNPARFLHATDSLGTVEAGKLADLVLLDGDPLADIYNVARVWGVVANGRYFDWPALERLDPDGWRLAQGNMEEIRAHGRVRGAALGLRGVRAAGSGDAAAVGQAAIRGVVADTVVAGAAAEAAGIAAGDILTTIDGAPASGVDQLWALLMRWTPGDRVQVEVVRRDGDRRTVAVTLGEQCGPRCY